MSFPEPKDKGNRQLLKEYGYDMLSYGLKPYGAQEEYVEARSILECLRECEQEDWEEGTKDSTGSNTKNSMMSCMTNSKRY